MQWKLRFALALFVAFSCAAPMAADWLVTREGARIETEGPWETRGRLVVFTLPNGTLSSMRASELDLTASEQATEEALHAAAAPPPPPLEAPPPSEPVLILTNRDIRSAIPANRVAEGDVDAKGKVDSSIDTGDDESGGKGKDEEQGVRVTEWSERTSSIGDGVEVTGMIENGTKEAIRNLQLSVAMIGDDEKTLGTVRAFLSKTDLPPGGTTSFRALIVRVKKGQARPKFQLSSSSG